jgi:hypothetical protein
VQLEGLGQLKIPVVPSRIETMTFFQILPYDISAVCRGAIMLEPIANNLTPLDFFLWV